MVTCYQRDMLTSRFYQLGRHNNYITGSCVVLFLAFLIFKQTRVQHSANGYFKQTNTVIADF